MKRQHDLMRVCSHEGCKESTFYSYTNKKEYVEAQKKYANVPWLCTRHTAPNEVLGMDNLKTEKSVSCKRLSYGKFWQHSIHIGTDKCDSGFMYGLGFKAYADDFPEGTIIKITAEVILPKNEE